MRIEKKLTRFYPNFPALQLEEITNVLELPELTEENCPNGYY